MTSFEIKEVQGRSFQRAVNIFDKLAGRAINLVPVWKDFIKDYEKLVNTNFDVKGKIMEKGKRWTKYTEAYKKTRKRKGLSGVPNLQVTGKLKDKATHSENWNVKAGKRSLTISLSGPDYFFFVENVKESRNPRRFFSTKGDNLPQRAMVNLIEIARDHLLKDVPRD